MSQLGDAFLDVQLGKDTPREGNRDPEQAPQGIYRAATSEERWLAITARNDAEWEALARVIGRDDLVGRRALRHRRRSLRAPRRARRGHQRVDRDAGRHRRRSTRCSGPASPPRRSSTRRCSPTTRTSPRASGSARSTSRDVGTFPHIGYAFQGVPQAWDRGAPVLGEDNDYVFRKVLQLDDDEYQRYVDAKVIVDDYLDADMNPV